MNGRERLGALLEGRAPDRVPFAPILSLYGARLTAMPTDRYYTDPEAYVHGQQAVVDLADPDVVCAPFCLTAEGAAFGGSERFLPNHPPNMAVFAVNGPGEFAHIRPPEPADHPRLRFISEATRRLRGRLGEQAMIAGICTSPVDTPALIMGMDAWLNTFLFQAADRAEVLRVTVPFFVEWANTLLAAGADFIGVPVAFANPTIVTREHVRDIVIPVLREAFMAVGGPIIFHHAGATLGPSLDLYSDLPNVVGFLLDAHDDLEDARKQVGPEKMLLGNVDGPTLSVDSVSAVRERADNLLCRTACDGRFVLATSAADIPWSTPPANILALREAVAATGAPGKTVGPQDSVVACSIFRPFIEGMNWEGEPPGRVIYLDSGLHVVPADLDVVVASVIEHERFANRDVLVAYGDCAPHLLQHCKGPGIRRTPTVNCCQALLGPERYRQLRQTGQFVFMGEWTSRWKSILREAFAADDATVCEIFRATNQGIVFIEPPDDPIPEDLRYDIVDFFGLPSSTIPVDGHRLRASLCSGLHALRGQGG